MEILYLIILVAVVVIPLSIGIIVSVRYAATDKQLNRLISAYGLERREDMRDALEKWANFDIDTNENYGYYIIHEPYTGTIRDKKIDIYKKIRFFTQTTTEDMKEIRFHFTRKTSAAAMVFFTPPNIVADIRTAIESRDASIHVERGMFQVQIPGSSSGMGIESVFANSHMAFEDLVPLKMVGALKDMRKYGACSLVLYKNSAAVNFDPFNKQLNVGKLIEQIILIAD